MTRCRGGEASSCTTREGRGKGMRVRDCRRQWWRRQQQQRRRCSWTGTAGVGKHVADTASKPQRGSAARPMHPHLAAAKRLPGPHRQPHEIDCLHSQVPAQPQPRRRRRIHHEPGAGGQEEHECRQERAPDGQGDGLPYRRVKGRNADDHRQPEDREAAHHHRLQPQRKQAGWAGIQC